MFKKIIHRLQQKWRNFFVKKVREEMEIERETESIPPQNVVVPAQPGLNCPRCDTKIHISIPQLLSVSPVICPACFLQLSIDTEKSKQSLDALRKLQNDLDKAGKK